MSSEAPDLMDVLAEREFVADCTDMEGLRRRFAHGPLAGYCGFDPTAPSLHVGSLTALAALRLLQAAGHRTILLMGGATGMIGDPSGRTKERTFLSEEALDANVDALGAQLRSLMPAGESGPAFVDNRDWLGGQSLIGFLRDVAKHISVRDMNERKSVRDRLAGDGSFSLTEFAYQALQAYDFAHLRAHHDCELQLGGTDQWGNITAGLDLMRRVNEQHGYGLVWPLLVKASGEKFGKTADGTVWLDGGLTSPFRFYQFWLATSDDAVRTLLLRLTERPVAAIDALLVRDAAEVGARHAQRALADDVTAWVHGRRAATQAGAAARVLFGKDVEADLDGALDLIADELGAVYLSRETLRVTPIEQLAVEAGLCSSLSDARRHIANDGLYISRERVTAPGPISAALADRPYLVLRRGRKTHALVRVR